MCLSFQALFGARHYSHRPYLNENEEFDFYLNFLPAKSRCSIFDFYLNFLPAKSRCYFLDLPVG